MQDLSSLDTEVNCVLCGLWKGDFGANLYLQTTVRSELEAELIQREIQSKIQ